MHLVCAYEARRDPQTFFLPTATLPDVPRLYSRFASALTHLSSATDTADELITRMRDDSYFAWDERKSQAARLSRRIPVDPMQPLHRYRNRLMHGPVIPHSLVPVIDASGDTAVTLTLPRLDKVRDVLDWRSFQHGEVDAADYAPAHSIFDHAWTDVMAYLRSEWRGMLGSAPGQAEAP